MTLPNRPFYSKLSKIGWHAREFIHPSGPPAYVASHYKCASVWTWNVVQSACRRQGIPARRIMNYVRRGPVHLRSCRIAMLMDHHPPNASPRMLAKTRLVHITRDPRGILASMLKSQRETHPLGPRYDTLGEMGRNRPVLQKLNDADGYRWLLENSELLSLAIESMIRLEQIACPVDRIDFRDIATNPTGAVERILRGIGISTDDVELIAEEFSFTKLNASNPHYRQGKADSWQEELPADVIRDFDAKWRSELEALGYPATKVITSSDLPPESDPTGS